MEANYYTHEEIVLLVRTCCRKTVECEKLEVMSHLLPDVKRSW